MFTYVFNGTVTCTLYLGNAKFWEILKIGLNIVILILFDIFDNPVDVFTSTRKFSP